MFNINEFEKNIIQMVFNGNSYIELKQILPKFVKPNEWLHNSLFWDTFKSFFDLKCFNIEIKRELYFCLLKPALLIWPSHRNFTSQSVVTRCYNASPHAKGSKFETYFQRDANVSNILLLKVKFLGSIIFFRPFLSFLGHFWFLLRENIYW